MKVGEGDRVVTIARSPHVEETEESENSNEEEITEEADEENKEE